MLKINAIINNNCNTFPPGKITNENLADISNSIDYNILLQIQKLDTIHDFGNTRGHSIACDTVTFKRSSDKYTYDQMRLSFLQKYSFPTSLFKKLQNINMSMYSSFNFPKGVTTKAVNSIEDYMLLLSLNHSIIQKKYTQGTFNDNFYCFERPVLTNDVQKLKIYKQYKQYLLKFFNNYKDTNGTTKINLMIDAPSKISSILKSDRSINEFAYVLTQESIHDSANKINIISDDECAAYNNNIFYEAFTNQTRYYKYDETNEPGNFESNFIIKFTGLNYAENPSRFYTNVIYEKPGVKINSITCNLNTKIHPTNIPMIVNEITSFTSSSSLFLSNSDANLLNVPNDLNISKFYSNFAPNQTYNYTPINQHNFDLSFTKKRAGDGLQARVCQFINSGKISIQLYKKYLDNEPGNKYAGLNVNKLYNIHKIVLSTPDRMLFAYCVYNNVPAIFTGTNFFICFKPDQTPIINIPPNIMSNKIPQQTKYNTRSRRSLLQLGGTNTVSNTNNILPNTYDPNDVNLFFKIIEKIPYIIFRILPFVGNYMFNSNVISSSELNELLKYTNITDNELITCYNNDAAYLTKVVNNMPQYITSSNSNELIKFNSENGIDLLNINNGSYSHSKIRSSILHSYFIGLLSTNINSVLTRSRVTELFNNFKTENINNILNYFNDENGSLNNNTQNGGATKNLLNIYIDYIYNTPYEVKFDRLPYYNLITIISYLCILSAYEIELTYDNDSYYQNFNIENGIEITDNISLYVMFEIIINEYDINSKSVDFRLLEYLMHSGDIQDKYFCIATDLITLINYVYRNTSYIQKSLNSKINDTILSTNINVNDNIFISSKNYFNLLFDKIQLKTAQVQSYLTNKQDIQTQQYISKYLRTYGFMNIANDFINKFIYLKNISTQNNQLPYAKFTYKRAYDGEQSVLPNKRILTMSDLRTHLNDYSQNTIPAYAMSSIRGGKKKQKQKLKSKTKKRIITIKNCKQKNKKTRKKYY